MNRITQNFQLTFEEMTAVADMIGAVSSLSTQLATASAGSNNVLTAANFDDWVVAVNLVKSLLDKVNGNSVSVTINTGGKVVLAFNRLL